MALLNGPSVAWSTWHIDPSRCSMVGATSRPWMGWGSGGASLTGRSRATHAWDRLAAGTPAHAVTAVTAVPVL